MGRVLNPTGAVADFHHRVMVLGVGNPSAMHQLPGGGTIQGLAGASNLLVFLRSIDGRTAIFESDGDIFKDPTVNLP